MLRGLTALVVFVLMSGAPPTQMAPEPFVRRMSFHNRLLLNRAVVSGLKSVEVLVLAATRESAGFQASAREIGSLVGRLGGRVLRTENDIGYVHLEVPTEQLVALVQSPCIEAYQIASLSKAAWYRDGPPLTNAEMFRGFEVTPIAAAEPGNSYAELPPLSVEASREPGYTADEDVGLREWMATHPTFDGRGVTIALVESGLPSFTDPTLRPAKTLDGREVSKIAGILNVVDRRFDDTRVTLDTPVQADKTWVRIGGRTYILPRPGGYRFGMLLLPADSNIVHQFAIVEDERTRDVWIDANGDASFQDESPLADVNERFEPRLLKLLHPRKADVSFVMARGRTSHSVHIYLGKSSHQTMTLSVAAGAKTADGLAYGVASNARVLLVRHSFSSYELPGALDGFIEAAKRPDVDVIGSSAGFTFVPDTGADFTGRLFERLVSVYHKPIFMGAGNHHLKIASSINFASALTVGGSLLPGTFAGLYGGRPLERLLVHPAGAAGPGLDGSIKPDFLAPMERIAADLRWNRDLAAVPKTTPAYRLPPGYQISCCTSASGPYAAGVAALLISAAKQARVTYSADSLARAMKVSARFIAGFGSHQQGNGVLDINAAWRELTHPADPPRIVSSAAVVHPLAQYAARGSEGVGILEFEGWTAGMTATREMHFRRESGPKSPVTFVLTWTGNDGTFQSGSALTLPLGSNVALPIRLAAKTAGVHSALLELRDPTSGAVAYRTQATVVATAQVDERSGSARITGRVGAMRSNHHYFAIPPASGALVFELQVSRGVVTPTIIPAHGLFPNYYLRVHPPSIHAVGRVMHAVVIPNPEPGTWTVSVENSSTWFRVPDDVVTPDDRDADYSITVRILDATIRPLGTARPYVGASDPKRAHASTTRRRPETRAHARPAGLAPLAPGN